ncbi:MAG: glycosyl transferase [Patescibacteria group bacterium]|nr:MAG: glycosyl transferase [Patescibacteria group bacterium]
MLSIVILTFNSSKDIVSCLDSIYKNCKKYNFNNFEVLIVDNQSTDDTVAIANKLKDQYKGLSVVINKGNFGFSKGNNEGVKSAKGDYLLFLNPDVDLIDVDFSELISFLDKDPKAGALSIKLVLDDGQLDKACHRGDPTLFRSVSYLLGLEEIFSKLPILNRLFGGYHLVGMDMSSVHQVEAVSGAFLLVKKSVFELVSGFDEDYFMYGEDLDLCLRIRLKGFKIYYYPKYKAVHHKYRSGMKSPLLKIRRKTSFYFWQAKKIYFLKHLYKKYPKLLSDIVVKALDLKISSFENK